MGSASKSEYKDRIMHIDFGENNKDLLVTWKRQCLYKLGKGGITIRIIQLLKEDLKRLEASK